jgi:Putative peptidoglycan binding domain
MLMKTRSAIKTWITLLALTAAGMMLATSAFAQTSAGSAPATTGTDVKSPPDTKSGAPASPSNASGGPTTGSAGSDMKSGTTGSDMKSGTTGSDMKSGAKGSDSAVKSDAMKSGLPERSAGSPEQVKAVQQALKEKGHDTGDVDGKMGPKTEAALRDFQQKQGLKATGRADAETMAKLDIQAANTGAVDSSSPAASPRGSSSSGSSSSSGAPSGAQSGAGPSPSDSGASKDATSTPGKQTK